MVKTHSWFAERNVSAAIEELYDAPSINFDEVKELFAALRRLEDAILDAWIRDMKPKEGSDEKQG